MSNVIQLLERLGRDADAINSADAILNHAAATSDLSAEIIIALKTRDQAMLIALLGARTNVFCAVFPAKQDEDEKDKQDEDEEEDAPDKGTENKLRPVRSRIALAG